MVGDRDRDRIIVALREHYARGRLTLEEFSARSDLVFASRSYSELRTALKGLPLRFGGVDLAQMGESVARAAVRGAVLLGETPHERAELNERLSGDPSPDAVRRALVEALLHGDRAKLVATLDETILGLRSRPEFRHKVDTIARALAG